MKRVLLAILLIFVFCSVSTAAIKDSPDGFRGIKWGDPPSKLGERNKILWDQVLSIYTKKGDKMTIGAAHIDKIEYMFVQDRLFLSASITVKYKHNCDRLRDATIARYGEPSLINETGKNMWGDDAVTISYEYDRYKDIATVLIISFKIYDKFEAAVKQLDESAAKDF